MQSTQRSATSSCPTLEALEVVEPMLGTFTGGQDNEGSTPIDRYDVVERRLHPRGGVVTNLEDITYRVLRHHELFSVAAA
jgi:hypothetical protein